MYRDFKGNFNGTVSKQVFNKEILKEILKEFSSIQEVVVHLSEKSATLELTHASQHSYVPESY